MPDVEVVEVVVTDRLLIESVECAPPVEVVLGVPGPPGPPGTDVFDVDLLLIYQTAKLL